MKIITISLGLHLLAAFFSSGFHHFDEHFQILEFLNYRLGNIDGSQLSWEFKSMVRPWFQIYHYFALTQSFSLFGITSPFAFATLFRLYTSLLGFLALLSLWPLLCQWIAGKKERTICWGMLHFAWFVPYIQVRTNAESFSTSFFLLGLSVFLQWRPHGKRILLKGFGCGLLLGAAYASRYQTAVMVAFLWFWELFLGRRSVPLLLTSAAGILCMIGFGVVVDYWGYGVWTFAPYNLLQMNIFQGVLKSMGETPWWEYFRTSFNRGIPPISLILILSTCWFWVKNWRHPLTWASLPFFLFHLMIGHKELRFLFPLIVMTPLMFALLLNQYSELWGRFSKFLPFRWGVKIVLGINFLLLGVSIFRPANPAVNFYRFIYHNPDIKVIHVPKDYNPYQMVGLDLTYYRRSGLEIKSYDKFANLDLKQGKWVFFSKGQHIFEREKEGRCQIRYLTYPRFTLNHNWGNWMSRSRVWSLYHCPSQSN